MGPGAESTAVENADPMLGELDSVRCFTFGAAASTAPSWGADHLDSIQYTRVSDNRGGKVGFRGEAQKGPDLGNSGWTRTAMCGPQC